MRAIFCITTIACMLGMHAAHGLILPFGQREVAEAGAGCVAGFTADHGTVAYFHGDTVLLNAALASLANDARFPRPAKVVLHAGAGKIVSPEESFYVNVKPEAEQILVDWSIRKNCPSTRVLDGTCDCEDRQITVEIWLGSAIDLGELQVPRAFVVRSAGELEAFVENHAAAK